MRLLTSPPKNISTRQVSLAAENMAAAQFALCGFDVVEQPTLSRSFYDLGVSRSGEMLKVSVHGSLEGFWDLVDPYIEKAPELATTVDCHQGIDTWLERHSSSVVCCLVQFETSNLTGMPRMYLASAAEVARTLHESTDKLGDSALYEQFEIMEASGAQTVESLPERWRFSQGRIAELMEGASRPGQPPVAYRFSEAAQCMGCAEAQPAACLNCLPMMN